MRRSSPSASLRVTGTGDCTKITDAGGRAGVSKPDTNVWALAYPMSVTDRCVAFVYRRVDTALSTAYLAAQRRTDTGATAGSNMLWVDNGYTRTQFWTGTTTANVCSDIVAQTAHGPLIVIFQYCSNGKRAYVSTEYSTLITATGSTGHNLAAAAGNAYPSSLGGRLTDAGAGFAAGTAMVIHVYKVSTRVLTDDEITAEFEILRRKWAL